MKLTLLKSALRTAKGAPCMTFYMPDGSALALPVQKTALIEALDVHFNKERSAETGLMFTDEGLVCPEPGATRPDEPPAPAQTLTEAIVTMEDAVADDLDDLLG